LSCAHHGADACCTACIQYTDGVGFPTIGDANGRRALRQCEYCSGWVERKHWTSDSEHAVFCCVDCMPAAYDRIVKHLEAFLVGATLPRRRKIEATIAEVRKRARRMAI
jgi:hypothetical protein